MLLPGSVLDAGRKRQSSPGLNGVGTGYRAASGRKSGIAGSLVGCSSGQGSLCTPYQALDVPD